MNESIEMLSKLLDCTALRQRVLANNLANANTPQFKRMDVRFQAELTNAIKSHDIDRINAVTPKIEVDKEAPVRGDGNSVSLQEELGEMSENALVYQFATRAIGRKFATLSKAIKGT
jgi:flagellar basal-body rod protein FlgB